MRQNSAPALNGNVEEQQVVALNAETPRPCDQLKQ